MLQNAIDKVNELISTDMGSLVEDKKDRLRERVRSRLRAACLFLIPSQRKWPEEKIPVGIDSIRNFNVRAKVVGPQASDGGVVGPDSAHSMVSSGYVCQIHPTGDEHSGAD